MPKNTIAIITDKPKDLFKNSYFVGHLIPYWRERQLRVAIGTKWSLPNADIAILHVDATKVSFLYKFLSKKYPVVLNGNFFDNSKRKVSRNLLLKEDTYQGSVIIKTNRNFGGLPELSKKRDKRKILEETSDLSSVDWLTIKGICSDKYPVIPLKSQVPEQVWNNKNLVVEKFLPEYAANGLFCLRACLFFGEQEVNILVTSRDPVIKGSNLCSWEILEDPVPDELRRLREVLRMDFGRLDYVISEGKVVLYDANKTATLSRQASVELAEQVVRPLSHGIDPFL